MDNKKNRSRSKIKTPLIAPKNWGQLQKLIKKRLDAGITAVELAQAYGVSPPRISVIENGGTKVTAEILERYSDALGLCLQLVAKRDEEVANDNQ